MQSLSHTHRPVRPAKKAADPEQPWRKALRDAIRQPHELEQLLDISLPEPQGGWPSDFPLLVPRGFAARMLPGDPQDPLLKQVLPLTAEIDSAGLPADAVGDLDALRAPGLIQKYRGRVLLAVAGSCAINCRYCFRRSFPYADLPHGEAAWEPALETIAGDGTISEVIFSGGDPLVLSDARLARLVSRIEQIAHVRRLRIHTRLPIVIPERVTDSFCGMLRETRLKTVVVLHVNHANEIDGSVRAGVGDLRRTGAQLLNQSVLLRGVNDNLDALLSLSEKLFDAGVMPYYLNRLDLVAGVGHHAVSDAEAFALVDGLRERLPGYLVPRYVCERPGNPSKTPLA